MKEAASQTSRRPRTTAYNMLFIASPALSCTLRTLYLSRSSTSCKMAAEPVTPSQPTKQKSYRIAATIAALITATSLSLSPVRAVSGGGKDYASQNWTGQTFHGSYSGKDFSGGLFRGCDFAGSDLTNTRFFKAELREANMNGVNLSYSSIEAAILRDTDFTDAVMVGSYISDSILDASSIENADFTDALISPESAIVKLCQRDDAKGVNSTTGASTRESLMCPY